MPTTSPEVAVNREDVAGKLDEAFEGVAEVANALQVMAEGMRFRAGAHNQDIARTHAALKAAVEHNPINQAAQAEGDDHQAQRNDDDAARDIVGVNEVKGSGEQESRR